MNAKRLGVSITFLLLIFDSVGQDQRFHPSWIPDSLLQNANAVILIDEGEYVVKGAEAAVFRTHEKVLILNSRGKKLANKILGYDKLRYISELRGIAYDTTGTELERSRSSLISDYSATSGGTLFDDNRVKHLDLEQKSYPYIVEFWTEKEYKTNYFTPDWYVLPDENVSVIKSEFVVSSPIEFKPNFLVVNSSNQMKTVTDKDNVKHSISFKHIKAQVEEPYGPGLSELSPIVFSSPGKFGFEGYLGSFDSWKEVGQWQNKLNENKTNLPEETVMAVRKLTANAITDEEKARIVYEYVQSKTRYVSIQLGIGGFQPFEAAKVDELGYGDCKALTNYTQSLLNQVGVRSHYTWVYGGSHPPKIRKEFPMDQFNHIILCVPNQADTIWLECTSQTNPFGYLGDFTGDREVMIVTEDGGKIVQTPTYAKEDNQQITEARVVLDLNGNATASIEINYTGIQHENGNLNYILNDGDDKLEEWIYKNTDISDFKITDFDFAMERNRLPVIHESLNVEIQSLTSKSGERVFLSPNLANRWKNIPKKMKERNTDIILSYEFQDSDSIIYELPESYSLEYQPKNISHQSIFGTFEVNYSIENNRLIYVRKVSRNKGRFPKESYQEFRNFYRTVVRADKAKVVFVDKT